MDDSSMEIDAPRTSNQSSSLASEKAHAVGAFKFLNLVPVLSLTDVYPSLSTASRSGVWPTWRLQSHYQVWKNQIS